MTSHQRRMDHTQFLFELGSTSIKLHFQLEGESQVRKVKAPWEIGHEVFQTGRISGRSMAEAVSTVCMFLAWMGKKDGCGVPAVATGAFRLAVNLQDFLDAVKRRTGLTVRVISEHEEASLLFRVVRRKRGLVPGFYFDLGGGSLQWVNADGEGSGGFGSVPLGAIRLLKTAVDAAGAFSPCLADRVVEQHLSALPRTRTDRVEGTGGTVRAISSVFERLVMRRAEIADLEQSVRKNGPPAVLMPYRRPVFLPGLILVLQLLKTVGAEELQYSKLSVGEALVEGLRSSLGTGVTAPSTSAEALVLRQGVD